jgi:hypothetical protein
MKGMVFTEFLEMVEEKFSPETAERIIESSELESSGVYTTVGTYDHHEMITLVTCLSRETGTPAPDPLRAFGEHLFERFHHLFPNYSKASPPPSISFAEWTIMSTSKSGSFTPRPSSRPSVAKRRGRTSSA